MPTPSASGQAAYRVPQPADMHWLVYSSAGQLRLVLVKRPLPRIACIVFTLATLWCMATFAFVAWVIAQDLHGKASKNLVLGVHSVLSVALAIPIFIFYTVWAITCPRSLDIGSKQYTLRIGYERWNPPFAKLEVSGPVAGLRAHVGVRALENHQLRYDVELAGIPRRWGLGGNLRLWAPNDAKAGDEVAWLVQAINTYLEQGVAPDEAQRCASEALATC